MAVQSDGDGWQTGKQRFCETCDRLFEPVNTLNRFCSPGCQYKTHLVPERTMDCRQCGIAFEGKGQPVCKQCVKENKDRLRRETKRIRDRCKRYGTIYTPGISRESIFDRDNWTCKLCGIECRRDGNYLEDDAPELDHVIAISKGGNHEESNLMCLCRKCNGKKSNKPLSQVLTEMVDKHGQKTTWSLNDQKTPIPGQNLKP